jgi:LPXTG-motif cell wall-anchored protein
VTTGGQIGLNLVGNKTKEIEGNYAVKLKELANNASLNDQQFKIELAKLDAEKDEALTKTNGTKQTQLFLLVGGLAVITAITLVLLLKKRK